MMRGIWAPFDSLDCPFFSLGFVTNIAFPQRMADMNRDLWSIWPNHCSRAECSAPRPDLFRSPRRFYNLSGKTSQLSDLLSSRHALVCMINCPLVSTVPIFVFFSVSPNTFWAQNNSTTGEKEGDFGHFPDEVGMKLPEEVWDKSLYLGPYAHHCMSCSGPQHSLQSAL